jgi:hypothetical protein
LFEDFPTVPIGIGFAEEQQSPAQTPEDIAATYRKRRAQDHFGATTIATDEMVLIPEYHPRCAPHGLRAAPFGALPGFSLAAEVREIAAYYGISTRQVRAGAGHAMAPRARHALFWKLATQRHCSASRVADLLGIAPKTVRDGVAAHEAEIAQFRGCMVMAPIRNTV